MAKLLDNKKMYVSSRERIILNNLKVDGTKARAAQGKVGKNATVLIEAPEVIIKGANATTTLSCWNLFEQAYSTTTDKVKKLIIKGGNFDMMHISHNLASFYTFADGAEIIFKDCILTKLSPDCNPIRLDNLCQAKGVTVTFDGCDWGYDNSLDDSKFAANKQYLALCLLQPSGVASGKNVFGDWKVIVKDCKFEGETITLDTFEDYRALTTIDQEGAKGEGKAILYVYDNGVFDCEEKAEFFPQVLVQVGSSKKLYKAVNRVEE